MAYIIYGKCVTPYKDLTINKKFAALDSKGRRVSRLADAMTYATKEDAQEILDKHKLSCCEYEIRKAK